MICGPTSTVISQSTFASGLTDTQAYDKNTGGFFQLPLFLSSVPSCVLITFKATSTPASLTMPGVNFVNQPVVHTVGTDYYKASPMDDSFDYTYEFYIQIFADGGSTPFYSTKMTLHIGCPVGKLSSA